MQLNIFEDSRDVSLRNAVIDALVERDAAATVRAIACLVAEYPFDSMLPEFNLLRERLELLVLGPLNRTSAGEILRVTENTIAVAQRVFGSDAGTWLRPLWIEFAEAVTRLPFDPHDELVHAAPIFLRAEKWVDATACLESISSWRRQPAPLAWKIEITAKISNMDQLWPLFTELSWMAPRRAASLTEQLKIAELTRLVHCFYVEFEDEGTTNDFAWFPAWVLIAYPQLADCFQAAQAGADTPAERCARLVLHLLALERQGRHALLIDGRKKLRDSHRMLFDRYMQSRPACLVVK